MVNLSHILTRLLLGRPLAYILISLFLFTIGAVHAHIPEIKSQSSIAAMPLEESTLIVGSEQNYPPFAVGMTDAAASGFTVELWKAVAAEVGLNYSIRVRPFHQILQEFKAGEVDVLINLAQSKERHTFSDFTVPHVVVHGAIFVRKGESSIHSENDLNGKSIIVLNADLAHDYAVSKGWKSQLVLVDTVESGLRLLASGKHDVMLLSKLAGMQTLQALAITNVEALNIKVGFSQKFSFAVKEGRSELLGMINEGLALTKSNGTYDVLYEKWFGVYEVKEAGLHDLLKYIIPIAILFISIMGYFFYKRQIERKQSEKELGIAAIAFESIDGVMITDANKIILRVNNAFTTITGYSAKEAIGQTPRLLSSGKSDISFYAEMWRSINTKKKWKGEVWNKRKNGELYPQRLSITAVTNGNGLTTNYVATFADITELKLREQQRIAEESSHRDTLVREVHHRIKNNLHAVTAVLSDFAESHQEIEMTLNQAISQVQSIAVIHGLQGSTSMIEVQTYELIMSISENVELLWGVSVAVETANGWIPCNVAELEAVPLALIINELVTNAIKYNRQEGGVKIVLSYGPLAGFATMSIHNTGIIPEDFRLDNATCLGTGLELVKSLLPRSGAELSWQQDRETVVTTLVLGAPVIQFE